MRGNAGTQDIPAQVGSLLIILLTPSLLILCSDDLRAAESLLERLKVAPLSDQDLAYQISMLEIDYLIRRRNFSAAFSLIDDMATQCEDQGADVYHRIRLLSTKALLFAKCGRPQKGLSLAVRALLAAYRSKTMVALWDAVGVLAVVLIGLEQFEEALRLVESVVYQVSQIPPGMIATRHKDVHNRTVGYGDRRYRADGAAICHMRGCNHGTCGQIGTSFGRQDRICGKGFLLDRSRKHRSVNLIMSATLSQADTPHIAYGCIEDLKGGQEMTAKAAVVAKLQGDENTASALATHYCNVQKAHATGGAEAVRRVQEERSAALRSTSTPAPVVT